MRRALLASAILASACGDPTLTLSFQIPQGYGELVDSVTLQIYTPPAAAPFGCTELAFAAADPDIVRISLAAELPARSEQVPLTGIDRVAQKVIVANGYEPGGRRLVVGCSEIAVIDEKTALTIDAVPTTRVRVRSRPVLAQVVGHDLPEPIVLGVSDARDPDATHVGIDQPLAGVMVRWRVVGPGGVGDEDTPLSNAEGGVEIRPTLPRQPGPYVLDTKVAWAETPPESVSGFVSPAPETLDVPGRTLSYRGGNVGPNGEPGLAALIAGTTVSTVKVALIYRSPSTGELLSRLSQTITGDGAVLGLLDHAGNTRDRAVVVTQTNWNEVGVDGELILRAGFRATPLKPSDAQPFGPCVATPDTPQQLVSYGDGSQGVIFYDAEGNAFSGFAAGLGVLASGCVSDQGRAQVRTLVVDDPSIGGLGIAAELMPMMYSVRPWFAVGFGMSFTRSFMGGPQYLLGTQLNVNDFVISRVSLERSADGFSLISAGIDQPPNVPDVNQAGDVDGDQQLDVIALFARPSTNVMAPAQYAIWARLGTTHEGLPLSGDFDVGLPRSRAPTMFVLDMDRDGVDDIVVAENNGPDLGATQTRVEVFSMGVRQ